MIVRPLRTLLALHRCGTIVAAATEVHLSPAAVSTQLRLLEEHLGIALFERTGRSIRLNLAAHKLLPLAEKLLAAYQELRQSSGEVLHGQLSLGVINGVLTGVFPAAIERVLQDSPGIEIKISSGTSPELVARVSAGLLDAVVVTQPPKPLGENYVVHRLYSEPIALIQAAGRSQPTLAAALASRPYIAMDRGTWAGQLIQAHLHQHGIAAEPVMELNSQEAILVAVRYGLGVTILPVTRSLDPRPDTRLRYKKLPRLSRVVAMVERSTHPRSHLTAQVLASLRSVVAAG